MMGWTDRHCRVLHRQFTRNALLFSEMVTANALIFGPRAALLAHSDVEHPLALQLGGHEPEALTTAARMGEHAGFDEINLNCGCPSDRVQNGAFGACLMRVPQRVAACVAAMKAKVKIPVSVKCRLGVDEQDPHESLFALADTLNAAGVDRLYVHARKAWLDGLSPKDNRTIPPLDYGLVHELKRAFPALPIILNGGLITLEKALPHLEGLDGVMFGRAAYHTPALLLEVDPLLFGARAPHQTQREAVEAFFPYVERELAKGARLHDFMRHMLGLFAGQKGARAYRQHLSGAALKPGAGLEVLRHALDHVCEGAGNALPVACTA